MKPPSRKHYERNKPSYKELEDQLEIARLNLLSANTYEKELKGLVQSLRTVADYFDVLKRSEVMVVTPEGMKYLVGQDLEDFCKAELTKQNENIVWWGDFSVPSGFTQHAKDPLSKIIRDEIDRCAVVDVLDAKQYITFKTKERAKQYDSRSKSKKESR